MALQAALMSSMSARLFSVSTFWSSTDQCQYLPSSYSCVGCRFKFFIHPSTTKTNFVWYRACLLLMLQVLMCRQGQRARRAISSRFAAFCLCKQHLNKARCSWLDRGLGWLCRLMAGRLPALSLVTFLMTTSLYCSNCRTSLSCNTSIYLALCRYAASS